MNNTAFDNGIEEWRQLLHRFEQLRHKSDAMDVGDMAWSEDHAEEAGCDDDHAIGYAKDKREGKTIW